MRSYIWIFAILLLLIIAIFTIIYTYNKIVQSKINFDDALSKLKEEFIPLKIKAYIETITVDELTSKKMIEFQIKFYSMQQNSSSRETVGTYRGSIEGSVFFIDFFVVKCKNSYLFFPYKIFSDIVAPFEGKLLYTYYEKNDFPTIYYTEDMDDNYKRFIAAIWTTLKNNDLKTLKTEYFGNAVHLVENLEVLEPNIIYAYKCHLGKGGIEIDKQ